LLHRPAARRHDGHAAPLGESLIIAWPQTVALIAGTIVLFVAGYIAFQRQEVRA
jgi:ABC-2 type transport system permease protein